MVNDSKIREFMHANRPHVSDSDKFMAELARQIELLPVPSALSRHSAAHRQTSIKAVADMSRSIKRYNHLYAVCLAVCAIASLSVIVLFMGMPSDMSLAVLHDLAGSLENSVRLGHEFTGLQGAGAELQDALSSLHSVLSQYYFPASLSLAVLVIVFSVRSLAFKTDLETS